MAGRFFFRVPLRRDILLRSSDIVGQLQGVQVERIDQVDGVEVLRS
jgi:hypothetical protein